MRRQPTDAERKLWSILRAKRLVGWKFRRQQQLGRYIVDFVCFGARIIVEADGSQHAESPADRVRTSYLEQQGFRVLRFWNSEILSNPDGVATAILAALNTPILDPSPTEGEEPLLSVNAPCSSPLAGEDSEAYPRCGLA
jgi:very-short-patch-repair endonuclease